MLHLKVKELIRNVNSGNSPLLKQAWLMSAIYLSILSIGILQHPLTREELHSEHSLVLPLLAFNSNYYTKATIMGCVASSILMDQVGRRMTFILGTLAGILCCFVVTLVSSPDTTRANALRMIFSGLSTGFNVILGTIVIGEYTSPKYRGVFLNLITTSMNVGSTIGLMLRGHYHWYIVMTASLLQIFSVGIATTWPESPYWLASKDHYKESEEALQRMRNSSFKKELVALIESRRQNNNKRVSNSSICEMTVSVLKKYSSSDFLRPITVIVFGIFLMESSGKHFVPTLATETEQIIGVDKYTYEIYTNVIITLSSIVTLPLVIILRHRTLLLITGWLSALVLFITSVFVFFNRYYLICNASWLGYLLILQFVFSNLGSTSIPLALIGEVFPLHYKSVGSLVSGLVISISSWAFVRSGPYLLSVLHLQGVLVLFSGLMTISLLVLFFILPETKHKTLLEIEEYLNNGRCSDDEIGGEVGLAMEYYTKTGTLSLL